MVDQILRLVILRTFTVVYPALELARSPGRYRVHLFIALRVVVAVIVVGAGRKITENRACEENKQKPSGLRASP
jgi:hypothetical protein